MLSLDAAVSVHYGKFRSLDLSPAAVCTLLGMPSKTLSEAR
jgi:hypothetical protein